MKQLFLITASLVSLNIGNAGAQIIKDPTGWTFSVKKKDASHYTLVIHAGIKKGWHMYALRPGGDGTLIPTSLKFEAPAGVKMTGEVRELSKPVVQTMEGIDGRVNLYEDHADFIQEVTGSGGKHISCTVEYQTCNNMTCLPPKKKTFSLILR